MTLSATLFEMSHREARSLLAQGIPAFLAVNPVEYHGSHLSLHNDALISAGLAEDAHAALALGHPEWPFLTAGELGVGVDAVPGPGSRRTSFDETKQIVLEACRSLAAMGARRVVLMTFHGAPMHNLAIESGVEWLTERGIRTIAPMNLLMQRLLDLDGHEYAAAYAHIEDLAKREALMRDQYVDFHAGFGETSLSLHYAPSSVSPEYRTVPPCPRIEPVGAWIAASRVAHSAGATNLAKELKLAAYGTGWQMLDPFPGYTGSPHLATPEAGAVFAATMVREMAEHAERVFDGRESSPKPIMSWLPRLTANGRLTAAFQHAV